MTTPREPERRYRDSYDRYDRDPYADPYGADRDDGDYDRDDVYDRPVRYGNEPEPGWQVPDHEPAEVRRAPRYPSHERYGPSWGRGPAVTGRRSAGRGRPVLWIAATVAGVVVVVVLVLGFLVPGWFVTRVLDASAVQNGVAKVLSDDYGVEGVADVRCPDGVGVVAGATFTCDATIDGDQVKVPVRVTDDRGRYEVGRPV